jgi:PAS domain S-box-containing protein
LHASEQRFRALVENSSDAIALLDAQGTIVYVSHSVQRMMGFAPEEMVETCAFDHIHPEDVGSVRQVFSALLKAPGVPMRAEYRRRHKDGTWRVLETTAMNRLEDPAVGPLWSTSVTLPSGARRKPNSASCRARWRSPPTWWS